MAFVRAPNWVPILWRLLCFTCFPVSNPSALNFWIMANPAQIFDDLAQRFKLEDAIKEQIIKLGVTTLSEFRFFSQDDSDLLAYFFTNAKLQKARLCQAWAAVCQAETALGDKGSAVAVSRFPLMRRTSCQRRS